MPKFYLSVLVVGIVGLYLGIGLALAGATAVGSAILLGSLVPVVTGQVGLKIWCNNNK